MLSISHETAEQPESRLRAVLAAADLVALPGTWTFVESTLTEPQALDTDVLAVLGRLRGCGHSDGSGPVLS
ncbi:DUF6196 family protein [Planotetraspora mira]|uniref:Uncharacterized protein n=1 Tax=Planotetraspora mira TaxID=58121 RepID=A0A8J3TX44_9ACTN|nr:DUF6196 family protein [Planotetraspora mira]GII33872.1 hypothetical protein Pmi06nite_73140 [Planotetraspora mira]